jgi:fructose-1,6-bisphosphatase-3
MNQFSMDEINDNMELLLLLSNSFKNIAKTTTELMNLKAIMNLPKGTEHFLSDIHGEYLAFDYIMRNGSGVIHRKIEDTFGKSLSEEDTKNLATLICYPRLMLQKVESEGVNLVQFYEVMIRRLLRICVVASSKYSRSKVNRALPKDFSYIINELLYQDDGFNSNRKAYYEQIIDSIIDLDLADELIEELCMLIQRFTVDHLHILGDIYDRGSGPHFVMDRLMEHHSLDIQWGNHDILWMGAAAGNKASIACAVRICLRYANTSILEDCYGINLLPLASLAITYYSDDPCRQFSPKVTTEIPDIDEELMTKMHKAIAIIQFKLEGQIIKRNPAYHMKNRMLLDKIDYDNYTLNLGGTVYQLNDKHFPTINPEDPYTLIEDEQKVIDLLQKAFEGSEKLQKHIRFLYAKGGMYLRYNDNLLFHACIPMTKKGHFREVLLDEKILSGKELMDKMDQKARAAYFNVDEYSSDFLWYLWCHKDSPLFGKDQMTTFERYFIDDKTTHKENSDPYFSCVDNPKTAGMVLEEFELSVSGSHIINGHIPVKVKSGVSPIKAGGKVLQIDGGFAKAYQDTTGIAGFTLIYNSYGLLLVSHKPFDTVEKVINEGATVQSTNRLVEEVSKRKMVADTDTGKEFLTKIRYLEMLVFAYKNGYLKEKE